MTLIDFGRITNKLKLNLSAKTAASHGSPQKKFADRRIIYSINIKHVMCTTSEMRRIATRYDKLATKYLAIIELPPIRIWLTATSVSGQTHRFDDAPITSVLPL